VPKCVGVNGFQALPHYFRDKEVNNAYFYSSTDLNPSLVAGENLFAIKLQGWINQQVGAICQERVFVLPA